MKKLHSFDYQNIALKESHFKNQANQVVATYLAIENDDLLHYFRTLAGIPDAADGLVGWYGNDASVFGQILGAYAKLYRVLGDRRLKEKALALADGWGECLKASVAVADANGTYCFDKLIGGLLDLYEYLDYAPAIDYVEELTKSAMRGFDRTVSRDGLQIMAGNMIEWYTLPEQLYRAYELSGRELFREFAAEWEYPYFWEKIRKGDTAIGPRHAYSHVNSLSSAARAYSVKHDPAYLEAMCRGYEEILANHSFATGGYGPAECLFPDVEGFLGDSLKASWDGDRVNAHYIDFGNSLRQRDDRWGSCEVSCCSWAVFKLTRYLMEFTGEAKYGDWAEKLLYNGCGGQPPVTPEGKIMYYADYFLNGGLKSTEDGRLHPNGSSFEWQCCTGTFPQDVAEYANLLYYLDEAGLYVSQYLPSSVRFCVGNKTCTLENTSLYPKERRLRFVFHTDTSTACTLSFRVPSWATARNTVQINGEPVTADTTPNTWLRLTRTWCDGDVITIDFAFTLRFEVVDDHAPDVAALVYGPIVLVCDKMTLFEGDLAHPEDWIHPIYKEGYSLAFRTAPGHVRPYRQLTRDFYPYYEVPEYRWYYLYNRINS